MLTEYATRGLKAGVIAGLAFGLFMALVGNPFIAYAETFEHVGHHHHGGPAVSGAVTTIVSIVGGVLWGILFGIVVFGVVFYFLEPAIPGGTASKSYVLGAAGFITVSGAPWLVLPPQPPGVEQALAVDARLTWYLGMMVIGALACSLSGYVYTVVRGQYGRALGLFGAVGPLCVVPIVAVIAPANPTSGPIPADVAYLFQMAVIIGQAGLWFVLATAHQWLHRQRDDDHEQTTHPDTAVTAD
jgi:predicted cobalt transporter CbtA